MPTDVAMKVCADHLRRDAFLYVRQSSLRQVFENTESTKRQYALRDRAVALGWPIERVHVIDSDLGLSGAQSEGRDGFQLLVTEVAMGHAGVVLGLEVSRHAEPVGAAAEANVGNPQDATAGGRHHRRAARDVDGSPDRAAAQ